METQEYKISLKHDSGTVNIRTVSSSIENAVKSVLNNEGAPLISIESIEINSSTVYRKICHSRSSIFFVNPDSKDIKEAFLQFGRFSNKLEESQYTAFNNVANLLENQEEKDLNEKLFNFIFDYKSYCYILTITRKGILEHQKAFTGVEKRQNLTNFINTFIQENKLEAEAIRSDKSLFLQIKNLQEQLEMQGYDFYLTKNYLR